MRGAASAGFAPSGSVPHEEGRFLLFERPA